MVTTNIIPSTEAHARFIAENVREPDRQELWACSYSEPLEVMLRALDRSEVALTALVNNEPICMWGVVDESFIGKIGTPWMVGTRDLDTHAHVFLRRCRAPLLAMLKDYDRLQNYVDARNTRTIRWLKFMGFTVEEQPEPYGMLRLPFHKFTMRGGNHV